MSDFKLRVPIQIRFRDTDAMGHVNNAVFLTYLELARMKYWEQITGAKDYSRVDFILASAEIDFRSPLKLGEEVAVHTRVSALSRSSFAMEYRVVAGKAERLVAEASTVQACYDYEKGKVKRLEEDTRRAIAEFENDPALFGTVAKAERSLEEGGEGG
jgi:acyl-CoA thioester hydrolase